MRGILVKRGFVGSAVVAGALALGASGASAFVVDFENESPLTPDPTNVGTSYMNGGITFTSTEDMQLVGTGNPTSGFVPGDNPVPAGAFDDVFLTGDFNNDTDMSLSFAKELRSISFDIADIDGGNDSQLGESNEEQFTFDFLLGGSSVGSQVVTSNDVAGDAIVTNITYSGAFDSVNITGVTPGGTRNIGWGIDNISATPVPLPAGMVLMVSAFGGLGALRLRRRKG